MKRIENYKEQLHLHFENQKNKDLGNLLYQELMNALTNYNDKRELTDYYMELQKKVLSVVH